jgi:4-hydroxy-4-methyl-2-oxoglutarate aldolase
MNSHTPTNSGTEDRGALRAAKLDTAALSDAMDKLNIPGQCLGIKPRDPNYRLIGRAFTVRYGPAGRPAGSVGDYIDELAPGTVVVLDNGGREDATVWGDILTYLAHAKGLAGTVIDGACRDTHLALKLGYPVFSRSYSMRTGKDRIQVESYGETVNLGDARVSQRDLLVGDADGVVAIPAKHEEAILAAAEVISKAEDEIRALLAAGMRLDEARKRLQYHTLQTAAPK